MALSTIWRSRVAPEPVREEVLAPAEKAASARAAAEPLTLPTARSHFVRMPLKFPLRVRRYGGDGKVSAFLITDSAGRSINICCEETELRREVAKLFAPAEAEELAKRIARFLTDEHDTERAVRLRQEEMSNPHSWAYKQQNG